MEGAVAQLVKCPMHKPMFVTTFEMILFFVAKIHLFVTQWGGVVEQKKLAEKGDM